jgi:hypothetical protein
MAGQTPYGLKVRVGDRRVHQHRLVAERAVGHPLPSTVQVHHVDEDKSNFTNSNLVICQDKTYHQLLHVRARVVRAGGDPNTQRVCGKCERVKPVEAFARRSARPGGRSPWCKECKHDYHAASKAVNRAA